MDKYVKEFLAHISKVSAEYAPRLILALITLLIGFWVIKMMKRGIKSLLTKFNIDPTIQPFLKSLISITLKIVLIISVADIVGVKTSSFIAILGAAGLAIGLALQGNLSNLAGGVLIIILKPFRVGNFIEAQGQAGVVKAIQIFHTHITTGDNKLVIIPNGALSNGNIINYSKEGIRRVDLKYGVSYDDDIKKVKTIFQDIIKNDKRILSDPPPFIGLLEFADSSVNFVVRPWCKVEDYWGVYFDFNEKVKELFDQNNITIPYPQREVYLHQKND